MCKRIVNKGDNSGQFEGESIIIPAVKMITVHWEVTVPLFKLFTKVIFSQMGTARNNKSIYLKWHALSKENGDQTIRKIL